jgi:AbrB family looped-hinge helix DNA binding protein
MKLTGLKVDSKGRIQVPKDLREQLGIAREVSVTAENGAMTIEPVERILDRLANEVQFNFKSIASELPKLRKTAEEELRQIR